jgi:thiosulfate/3-mercaptopyruvate sulfurtransferase
MAASPLVTTAWLEEHLADPALRIIEVCSRADDKAYRDGHIPRGRLGLLEIGVLA